MMPVPESSNGEVTSKTPGKRKDSWRISFDSYNKIKFEIKFLENLECHLCFCISYFYLADKPSSTGRPQLMSVNEDNIETLVGSANIANPHTDGKEEEKITFKDEKADSAAAKNLGRFKVNLLRLVHVLQKTLIFSIWDTQFLQFSSNFSYNFCKHEKNCINPQIYWPDPKEAKEEEDEGSQGGMYDHTMFELFIIDII